MDGEVKAGDLNGRMYSYDEFKNIEAPSIMDIPEPGYIKLSIGDWTKQEKNVLAALLAVVNDRRSRA